MTNIASISTQQLIEIDNQNKDKNNQCLNQQTRDSLDHGGYHTLVDYCRLWGCRGLYQALLLIKVEGTHDGIYERIDISDEDMDKFQITKLG